MSWLLLTVLAAAPLDDVAPLQRSVVKSFATVTRAEELPGATCRFEKRVVHDPMVEWQWVARCPVEDVRVSAVGPQAGVRLFTQQSHWTLLVLDGARAVDLQESPEPTAPAWVSRPLLRDLQRQYQELSTLLAHDARDGSSAVQEWGRGYERVTPSSAPTGPVRTPLFEGPPPPMTPTRVAWFNGPAKEPWLFYAEDPQRHVELSLRAPGGETRQLLTLPARAYGGSSRVGDLTHVTSADGEVFSMMVDGRHLVLWPRADGAFLPRVAGVSQRGQPPDAVASELPCGERTETRHEESVSAPRLFLRGRQPWAAWLTGTSDTRWHLGPVLMLGARDERRCEWILDGREDHVFITVGRFTADGQLEEQLRIPSVGATFRLQLAESGGAVTLATVANGVVTVTRLKAP